MRLYNIHFIKKVIYLRKILLTKLLIRLIFIYTLSSAGNIFAQSSGSVYIITKNLIVFHSNTTQELIKATSGELKGIIDAEKRTFAFSIAIKTFDGFNSPLQKEHFNENYMESEKFPTASFIGHIIEEDDFTKDGIYNIRAKGKFTLHGVEQERILQGDLIVKKGSIKLSCIFTVFLSEHDIKIPRIVHEKLASEIKVFMNAEFIKK